MINQHQTLGATEASIVMTMIALCLTNEQNVRIQTYCSGLDTYIVSFMDHFVLINLDQLV